LRWILLEIREPRQRPLSFPDCRFCWHSKCKLSNIVTLQCGLRVGSFGWPISPVEAPSPVKVKRVESTEWVCMQSRQHSHGETGPTCSAGFSAKAKDVGAGVPTPLESLWVEGSVLRLGWYLELSSRVKTEAWKIVCVADEVLQWTRARSPIARSEVLA
jgi:hypothetical protein